MTLNNILLLNGLPGCNNHFCLTLVCTYKFHLLFLKLGCKSSNIQCGKKKKKRGDKEFFLVLLEVEQKTFSVMIKVKAGFVFPFNQIRRKLPN